MSYIDEHYKRGMTDLEIVKPCLETWLGCQISLLEKGRSPLECQLDTMAGIDAIAVKDGLKGLALRCQWGSWDTFTVRYKRATGNPTEFQKFNTSNLRPNYTMQIYLHEGEIVIGCASYDDLMRYVQTNADKLEQRKADGEGNIFLVIPFDLLEKETWFTQTTVACEKCSRKSIRKN